MGSKPIELPPLASIEHAPKDDFHGNRRHLFTCSGCGLGRRMASMDSAAGLAWSHAEDFPCDALERALEEPEETPPVTVLPTPPDVTPPTVNCRSAIIPAKKAPPLGIPTDPDPPIDLLQMPCITNPQHVRSRCVLAPNENQPGLFD